jgi:hypothetical protein
MAKHLPGKISRGKLDYILDDLTRGLASFGLIMIS